MPPDPVFTIVTWVIDAWPHGCWSSSTDSFAAPFETAPESVICVPNVTIGSDSASVTAGGGPFTVRRPASLGCSASW